MDVLATHTFRDVFAHPRIATFGKDPGRVPELHRTTEGVADGPT
jgi:hypothetical protein